MDGIFDALADQRPAMAESPPSHLRGVRHVGDGQMRMRLKVLDKPRRGGFQSRACPGGNQQKMRKSGAGEALALWGLLEHHMRVRSSNAESTNSSSPRKATTLPIGKGLINIKWTIGEWNGWVRLLEI